METEHGVTRGVQSLRDQAVRIYLLYLVGITLFIDKSQNDVDVVYLRYFRYLDLVDRDPRAMFFYHCLVWAHQTTIETI